MTRFALSTMSAQHERLAAGDVFARFAAEAGFEAIELSHSTPARLITELAESKLLPIVAVHQPAPWEQSPLGMPNTQLNLASLDEDERREAVFYAKRSIELAVQLGARAVVLHMGNVEDAELRHMDQRLRARSAPETFVPGALRRSAIACRSQLAEPYVAAARRSLLELLESARPAGITLGLESRMNFHEIPLPGELPVLLDGIDPEAAGYWHDIGHAEILSRLGYIGPRAWFSNGAIQCVGAHVHDVDGIVDHRAPGRGDVDWDNHIPSIAHLDYWTFEINQFEPDTAVCDAPRVLREQLSRIADRG